MADTIVDGTLLNVENIKYSAPKANASGGKSINILNKNTNTGLRITAPVMLTWGASDFQDPATGKGNGKFEMALQFPSEEYSNDAQDVNMFLKNIQNLESKIKRDALENSKTWFGKVLRSEEVVDALYTPMLKYSKNKITGEPDLSRSPTLKVKLPIWEGKWKCEIYDEEGERLFPNTSNPEITPIDFIQKGTNVGVLIQCGGIWFANGKFGVTWKLIQAMVQAPKASLTGKCFYKVKETDKAKITSSKPKSETLVDDEYDVNVEDSDNENDYKMEQVSAPAPVPIGVPIPVMVPVQVVSDVVQDVVVQDDVVSNVEVVVEEPKKKKIIKKTSK